MTKRFVWMLALHLCIGEQGEKEGYKQHRPRRVIRGQAFPEQRNALCGLSARGHRPRAEDCAHSEIVWKAVLRRNRDGCARSPLQFLTGVCRPVDPAGLAQRMGYAVTVLQLLSTRKTEGVPITLPASSSQKRWSVVIKVAFLGHGYQLLDHMSA